MNSTSIQPIRRNRPYRGIYEKIHRRQLRSGETVNAQQLVEELGVSLMTVRQALEWACRDGLFIRIPRKGWKVITLDAAEMRDIYECRLLLEPLALREAMKHILQQTIDDLLNDCNEAISAGDDLSEYDREVIDMRFHRTLVANANSKTLAEVVEPLLRKRLMYFGEYRGRHHPFTFAEEHREILKAIRDQDVTRAVDLLVSHLERAQKTHIANMSDQNNDEACSN